MAQNCKVSTKPKTLKEFLRSWNFWRPFLGIFVGGTAGFLYYHFVGCSSGTCAITSHAYSSILFGGLSGFLITSGPCTKC
jgi:hypothetical protein